MLALAIAITPQALFSQLLVGLINGSFYALLSLGLAIIFGLLNVINFAHGALYTCGAFAAWLLLGWLGGGFLAAPGPGPLLVGGPGGGLQPATVAGGCTG